jgi:hypothetical protein
VTRVLVESSNGVDRWTTIGVSDNILEASYQAVAQGIEYGLIMKSPLVCSIPDSLVLSRSLLAQAKLSETNSDLSLKFSKELSKKE